MTGYGHAPGPENAGVEESVANEARQARRRLKGFGTHLALYFMVMVVLVPVAVLFILAAAAADTQVEEVEHHLLPPQAAAAVRIIPATTRITKLVSTLAMAWLSSHLKVLAGSQQSQVAAVLLRAHLQKLALTLMPLSWQWVITQPILI